MAPLVYQTAGVPLRLAKTSSDNETWPTTQQSKARQEKENPEREREKTGRGKQQQNKTQKKRETLNVI